MVTTARPHDATGDEQHYRVIGTRPIRPDGVDKVTGRAQYGADTQLSGQLHARVLRSPHAHARILKVDTSKARALDGVKAVVTHADFPQAENKTASLGEGTANFRESSMNCLADGAVFYKGHAVAAVAATSLRIAEEALSLIEVEYEPLPPVLNVREAMAPGSPIVHPNLSTKSQAGPGDSPTNVAAYTRYAVGDIEAGFAEADAIVEREYTTEMVHQGYIEPHACSAHWNADGNISIWTSTQGPFSIRDQVSGVLRVPVSKIKVVPTEIGGGFGGKIPMYIEAVAAMLSKQAGAPVKLVMDRHEVFEASGPASGVSIKLKIGGTKEGKITAVWSDLAFEAGAFGGSPVAFGAICMFGSYSLPNVVYDCYDVIVNKPKVAAYRAPGAPQATFAGESAVDELAEKLGLDPIAFRLANVSRQGTRFPNGMPIGQQVGAQACMEAARETPHWQSPLPESTETKKRGRGLSMGYWPGAPLKSSVNVIVNTDGTVMLIEGNPDIGGTRASLAMQLAEALGIPYESVKPQVADTDTVGYTDVTGGSRTTFATGIAAIEAAQDVIVQLKQHAARIWSLNEEDKDKVRYDNGRLYGPGDEHTMSFEEIASKVMRGGTPIVGRATVSPKTVGMAFACHIVDVEVDAETGKTEILRYTALQDAGKAIHPSYVEGQMQGGVAQGVGWALNEEYVYDAQGRLVNSNFLDYRMPTALDLPMIDTVIVEVPHPGHPYGVRGVGEAPIVPPLAAVANAMSHALGHRFTALPISPRRILEETVLSA